MRDGHYFTSQVNKIFWLICGNDHYSDSLRNFKLKIYKIIVKYYYHEGNKTGTEIKKKNSEKKKNIDMYFIYQDSQSPCKFQSREEE